MIFALLITICKGGLWICIGVLFGNHLETILSLILRKPIPEGLISPDDIKKTKILFKIMGLIIILTELTLRFSGFARGSSDFIVLCSNS
jgi:hypothetical protein